MATERTPIHISPESELSLVLRRAAQTGGRVLVDAGDAAYELDVHPTAATPATPTDVDRVARTIAGLRRAAGGWQDIIDADTLTTELYERRRTASRPPVEL